MDELQKIIRRRRTSKPVTFSGEVPDPGLVRELIEIARYAPNHHKTEPARFYLLGREKIGQVGKLFGAVAAGDGSDPSLVEKGKRKEQEWSSCPGLLVVTCHTDQDSDLARRYPDLAREDYATCSCICQNLLLLMESKGISSKWSTGPVWKHPEFARTIEIASPGTEEVVALIFYGYSDAEIPPRPLAPLEDHLKDFS